MIAIFMNEASGCEYIDCGCKWDNLCRMFSNGFSVPRAYVIRSDYLELMVDGNWVGGVIKELIDKCDYSSLKDVGRVSGEIRRLIVDAEMPRDVEKSIIESFLKLDVPSVAVRSSATFEDREGSSAAGQLESFLEVSERDLIYYVKLCWSSLYGKNILWNYRDFPLSLRRCSVIVQEMISAEVAGVSFSSHANFSNQMVIEAAVGLGEAVVSGAATPDIFVLDKGSGEVLEKKVYSQSRAMIKGDWVDLSDDVKSIQKLSDDDVVRLGGIIKGIEDHYGHPVDVEWAKLNGNFYITQCRPIVAVKSAPHCIEAAEYDFLWQTGCSHFFCSIYLESGYLEGDFVSFHSGSQHTLFVSKEYRKILGNKALYFYTDGFDEYAENAMTTVEKYKDYFEGIIHEDVGGG